jgi:hypothetical protein
MEEPTFCGCFEMRYSTIEAFDRTMLICWLCKDFGWMSMNAWVGIPFGIMCLWLHAVFIWYDRRESMSWINSSLMLWIIGNFMWMTCEFIYTRPPTGIEHLGPTLPLGGFPEADEQRLLNITTVFFVLALSVQATYYAFVGCGVVSMPGEDGVDEDDVLVKSDIQDLCCEPSRSRSLSISSSHSRSRSFDETAPKKVYTSTFIENAYVVFWIIKDLFWALGTGSIEGITGRNQKGREVVYFLETIAIVAAICSFLAYFVTAYLMRRNGIRFLDAVSASCWVLANTVWMCGEFFVRYDSLAMDDEDEADDIDTRLGSTFLFSIAIIIQIFIVIKLTLIRCSENWAPNPRNSRVQVHSSFYSPFGSTVKTHMYTPQKTGQEFGDLEVF